MFGDREMRIDFNSGHVWARNLTGGDVAVAFYNEGDTAKRVGINFASLGWDADTKAAVKDLWGKHSAASPPLPSTATGQLAPVTVRPHSTVLLRLSKVRAARGQSIVRNG